VINRGIIRPHTHVGAHAHARCHVRLAGSKVHSRTLPVPKISDDLRVVVADSSRTWRSMSLIDCDG